MKPQPETHSLPPRAFAGNALPDNKNVGTGLDFLQRCNRCYSKSKQLLARQMSRFLLDRLPPLAATLDMAARTSCYSNNRLWWTRGYHSYGLATCERLLSHRSLAGYSAATFVLYRSRTIAPLQQAWGSTRQWTALSGCRSEPAGLLSQRHGLRYQHCRQHLSIPTRHVQQLQ